MFCSNSLQRYGNLYFAREIITSLHGTLVTITFSPLSFTKNLKKKYVIDIRNPDKLMRIEILSRAL